MKKQLLSGFMAFGLFGALLAQIDTTQVGDRVMMRANWGTIAQSNQGNGGGSAPPCTSFSYYGTNYAVTEVGDQCWMAESMAARMDSNGDIISSGNSNWATTSAAGAAYYSDASSGKTAYNYAAAMSVCPSGWRLPYLSDFQDLKTFAIDVLGFTTSTCAQAIKDETWGSAYLNYTGWNAQSSAHNLNVSTDGTATNGNGLYWATGRQYLQLRGGGGSGNIEPMVGAKQATEGLQVRCVRSMTE